VLHYIFRPSLPLKHLLYIETTGEVRYMPPRAIGTAWTHATDFLADWVQHIPAGRHRVVLTVRGRARRLNRGRAGELIGSEENRRMRRHLMFVLLPVAMVTSGCGPKGPPPRALDGELRFVMDVPMDMTCRFTFPLKNAASRREISGTYEMHRARDSKPCTGKYQGTCEGSQLKLTFQRPENAQPNVSWARIEFTGEVKALKSEPEACSEILDLSGYQELNPPTNQPQNPGYKPPPVPKQAALVEGEATVTSNDPSTAPGDPKKTHMAFVVW
jgi:hypothetical protein